MSELTEEEIQLEAELKQIKAEVFQTLLPALVASPNDTLIISQLVMCGERLAQIDARQPVAYLERKKEAAHNQRMMDQETAKRKQDALKAIAHKQVKRDHFAALHPARYIETAVQKEVNRQLRSNGGIIRLESGDGK